MRRGRGLAGIVVVVSLVGLATPALAAPSDPVRLLITYDDPVTDVAVLADAGAARSEVLPAAAASRVQVLELPDDATATAVARRLAATDGVAAVEPDVRLQVADDLAWGVENTGQLVNGRRSAAGIDIGVGPVRSIATGRGVVVAVIDTGVDTSHPGLSGRMWRNPGESVTGRDDDANGYVDDVHGWDFVRRSPNVAGPSGSSAHGTHVAGIIAGVEHPPTGFAGVAPGARIMSLAFIDEYGSGWGSDLIAALRYARDNGADVINLSIGSPEHSATLATAIAETGLPVITAAGNTGRSHEREPVYPAAVPLPNQLVVAAVDRFGAMADFSATSTRTVHVAAPGVDILSLYPGSQLVFESGTSMATPFVAGIVALAIEAAPQASTQQLLAAVQIGARPLAGVADTVTGGIARATGTLAALGVDVPVCRAPEPSRFLDVPPAHTHHYGVACLTATRVARGVTADHFGAAQDLTRAQVATLVANALEPAGVLPAAPVVGRFDDATGSVHRDAIERLALVEIVGGDSFGRYGPDRIVTRAEFAGIVARAAEHAAGAAARAVVVLPFDDLDGSPDRAWVERAAALSLVAGRSPGVFDPDTSLRRDQAATMLVRLLDRLHHQGLLPAV